MTNFEKITQSPETLAEFIDRVTQNCIDETCFDCPFNDSCLESNILDWLKQQAEEDLNDL